MNRYRALLAACASLTAASTTKASEAVTIPSHGDPASRDASAEKNVVFGLGLGYGLPLGKAGARLELNDIYTGMIPIWVEAGYLVTPKVALGAFFHYAFTIAADSPCDLPGIDCTGDILRFGLQGSYRTRPGQKLDPWLGFGIGYEIATFSVQSSIGGDAAFLKGIEFANFQGGADFELAPALGLGPFVSFSLGEYSKASSGPLSIDVPDRKLHSWLLFGVKSSFFL